MNEILDFPIRSDKLRMTAKVSKQLLSQQSPFQKIEFLDTEAFGKVMLLDGHIQLTELDEHVYHEALVQIPLLNISQPSRALVIGGGDGAVLRELVKHPHIEHIDMVEIDEAVVKASLEAWPALSAGAFDHPKVHLKIADAFPFVKDASAQYDLIVMDSTDVYEEEDESLSERLFTQEFYRDLARLLKPKGFLITQADNLVFCPYSLDGIRAEFSQVFANVGDYFAVIPSFGGFSGYCWASHTAKISPTWESLHHVDLSYRFLNKSAYEYGFSELPLKLV